MPAVLRKFVVSKQNLMLFSDEKVGKSLYYPQQRLMFLRKEKADNRKD